jgi:hypothetical protein
MMSSNNAFTTPNSPVGKYSKLGILAGNMNVQTGQTILSPVRTYNQDYKSLP